MSRRPIAAAVLVLVFGALALAPPRAARAQSAGQPAAAQSAGQSSAGQSGAGQSASQPNAVQESGNPINDQGSSYNYRSNITAITPGVPGLSLQVLEFADRLQLENHTGKTVTIDGYEGEPYARVQANGTVEVNTRSPAYYLNENFYGQVTVPATASAHAVPRWTVVDRTGVFEWHDHRIHWMSPVPPAQVKDKSRRTKIFDWQVPIQVGNQPGAVNGQLFWEPEEGTKTPVGAIVALVAIVLLGLGFVLLVRRRRSSSGRPTPRGGGEGGKPGAPSEQAREAW